MKLLKKRWLTRKTGADLGGRRCTDIAKLGGERRSGFQEQRGKSKAAGKKKKRNGRESKIQDYWVVDAQKVVRRDKPVIRSNRRLDGNLARRQEKPAWA